MGAAAIIAAIMIFFMRYFLSTSVGGTLETLHRIFSSVDNEKMKNVG
jgi:hypothetical protein